MPLDQFVLLCLFVAALVGTPGPANLSLMAAGLSFGPRATLPFLIGTLAGFELIFVLNAAGLLALLQGAPVVWQALRFACVAYIVYLAVVIVRARPKSGAAAADAPGFWRGFWLHPLNPKAYAMQVAGIAQFASPERYVADAAVLALTFLLLGGGLNACWMAGGRLLARLAGRPARLRAVNAALAVLMVASTIASLHLA